MKQEYIDCHAEVKALGNDIFAYVVANKDNKGYYLGGLMYSGGKIGSNEIILERNRICTVIHTDKNYIKAYLMCYYKAYIKSLFDDI